MLPLYPMISSHILQLLSFPGCSDGKESCSNAGDLSLIPGWGRFLEEGNGNPLQDSCLGNSMEKEVWRVTVHGVAIISFIIFQLLQFSSVQSLSRVWLRNPMNRSTPGLPVHHKLLEFTQTHTHWVGDAIQPFHPLSSPSPPAPNPSQHQGLFQRVNSLHEVAKVLEFQLQHQSFQWTPRTDLL